MVPKKVCVETQTTVAKGQKIGRAEAIQIWVVYFQRYHYLLLSVAYVLRSRFLKLNMNLAAYCQASSIQQLVFLTLFEAWVARCSPLFWVALKKVWELLI